LLLAILSGDLRAGQRIPSTRDLARRLDIHANTYVGGTVPNVTEGQVGRLDTTVDRNLVFEYGSSRVEIPYASMQRYQYTQRLARRMGVAPTIAVGIVKRRQRRHIVEVFFRDASGVNQVAVFEVSKDRAAPVVAVLNARVPHPVRPS
jgi:hypothetical protein